MENKNVEFQNELSDNLSIGFDDVSLRQILINIILNALEASESNGLIKIFAAPVQIESVQYLEIKISDNAGGISPDHLPYIFNPFFTTKNESNSHGIGLSITREIVEQSGGIIKVDSDWGVGTTFTIYLKR
jgi:two-component system NtrC family sensor kinase